MEPVIVMTAASEYNAATERVNTALKTLKNDLISLRHQDVTLLKQLIHINETIRTLSKDSVSAKNRMKHGPMKLSASYSATSLTKPCSKWRTPLVRQSSVPKYCNIVPEESQNRDSTSSGDDSSLDESFSSVTSYSDLEDSVSTSIPVFNNSAFSRQRSRSMKVPTTSDLRKDDTSYEEILKRNVRLWKVSQNATTEDSDSVFEEDSEGELIENDHEN